MPRWKRNSLYNAGRKARRIAKYGKYARPAGATRGIGYRKGRRGAMSIFRPKFLNPFTRDSELVQLTYRQPIVLNPNAENLSGGTPFWSFSFNNMYDPDVSSTGHQPMFFDNYSQIYGKYKVSFAKIKVTVVNHSVNTATMNGAGTLYIQPNNSYRLAIVRDLVETDYPNTMDTLLEQNAANVKWRYVAPQLNGKLPTLSMKCAPHKTAGVAYDDDTLTATTATSPARNIKGTIFIASSDGVSDPPSVNLQVEITYYVKFFDRNNTQTQN